MKIPKDVSDACKDCTGAVHVICLNQESGFWSAGVEESSVINETSSTEVKPLL